MLDARPPHTLEIGLSFGGSAMALAASHRDLGRAGEGQHVALDPYQSSLWDEAGLLNLEKAGLKSYVEHRGALSAAELPRMLLEPKRFGLIYVDGSHLFEDVFVDAYYCIRLLQPGGLIAFDDSSDPHVAKVINFLRANLSGSLTEVDLSSSRARGLARLRYRLARAVGAIQLRAFKLVGQPERDWRSALKGF